MKKNNKIVKVACSNCARKFHGDTPCKQGRGGAKKDAGRKKTHGPKRGIQLPALVDAWLVSEATRLGLSPYAMAVKIITERSELGQGVFLKPGFATNIAE